MLFRRWRHELNMRLHALHIYDARSPPDKFYLFIYLFIGEHF